MSAKEQSPKEKASILTCSHKVCNDYKSWNLDRKGIWYDPTFSEPIKAIKKWEREMPMHACQGHHTILKISTKPYMLNAGVNK